MAIARGNGHNDGGDACGEGSDRGDACGKSGCGGDVLLVVVVPGAFCMMVVAKAKVARTPPSMPKLLQSRNEAWHIYIYIYIYTYIYYCNIIQYNII